MYGLQGVIRLWVSRVVWFLVVAVLAVMLIHLRAAYVWEERPIKDQRGMTRIVEMPVFSWEEYRRVVKAYPGDLFAGNLYYRTNPRNEGTRFSEILREAWWNSFRLFVAAAGIGVAAGVLVGTLVGLRSLLPRVLALILSIGGLSLPDFLVVFIGQAVTIWTYRVYDWKPWLIISEPSLPKGWILPLGVLILPPLGFAARLTASAMDDIMRLDYIRTARSKGLHEVRVVLGHALRNAIPRILSGLPTLLNVVLSSMIVVERLTAWPGMAFWLMGESYQSTYSGPDGIVKAVVGVTPQLIATAGILFIAWFLLLDGLAHTVRILFSVRFEEVKR